jgi:hypothetical protein
MPRLFWRVLGVSIVAMLFGARFYRLAVPSRLIFDEPDPVGAAEALNAGEEAILPYVHPPLAPTVQALMLRWARPTAPTKLPLPFIPRSGAYVPAHRTLYLLSPEGSTLAALDIGASYRLRTLRLSRPLQSLAPDASLTQLMGISTTPQELVAIRGEGHCQTLLPLAWIPTHTFVSRRHRNEITLVDALSGRMARWRLRPCRCLWSQQINKQFTGVAYNSRMDWLYLALPNPPRLCAMDGDGTLRWQQRLTVIVEDILPVASYNTQMALDPLYALDSYRQILFYFPSRNSWEEAKSLDVGASVRSIGFQEHAAHFYLLSDRSMISLDSKTHRIIDRLPVPERLKMIAVTPDDRFLIGVAAQRAYAYIWRLPSRALWARLPSVFLLGLMMPVIGIMLLRCTYHDWNAVLIFLFLVSCDPLLWTLSRLAHPEAYVITAVLTAYVSCFICLQAQTRHIFLFSAFLSGLFAGIAIGTKWSGITALGGIVILTTFKNRGWFKKPLPASDTSDISRFPSWVVVVGGALIGYVICFALLWRNGMSWEEWLVWHWDTAHFHTLHPRHPRASWWWQWPLGGGTWRVFHDQTVDDFRSIYLCGTPWLWLPGLVCIGILAARAWRTRELFPTLLVVAIAFSWLPWMFAPRTTFIYHFAMTVPIFYIAVATVIGNIRNGGWQIPPQWRDHVVSFGDGYVILAFLTLIWLYPILVGYPLPSHSGKHSDAWWMGWLPALTPR